MTTRAHAATMTDFTPSLAEVRRMAGQATVAPIYLDVRADLETPVSAFLKIARGPYSFLLESVEGGERVGRYSFIGTEPYRVMASNHEDGDPLKEVEAEVARLRSVEIPGLPRFHRQRVSRIVASETRPTLRHSRVRRNRFEKLFHPSGRRALRCIPSLRTRRRQTSPACVGDCETADRT